jgi:hypothetical protein
MEIEEIFITKYYVQSQSKMNLKRVTFTKPLALIHSNLFIFVGKNTFRS